MTRAVRVVAVLATTILVTIIWSTAALSAPELPKFTNYVVDNANVIDDNTENLVNGELRAYQDRSTNQIAMLVVDSTSPKSIEDYAVDVGRAWGVGQQGKDNGVLVVIAMSDRKGRIEVGYGLQGQLPDLKAKEILDTQTFPRLKEGNVNEAIQATETAIRAQLGDDGVTPPPPAASATTTSSGIGSFLSLLPILIFFLIIAASRRGGGRRGGLAEGMLWGGLLSGLGRGGFGGGFGGGSFGGGGFGGGGGGSFGGGGASGDW